MRPLRPPLRVIVAAPRSLYAGRKGTVLYELGDVLEVLLDDATAPLEFDRREVDVIREAKFGQPKDA